MVRLKTYSPLEPHPRDKIQIAQGKRSRREKTENQYRIWMLICERGKLTVPELKKETGLGRKSIWKNLRELEESGVIFKDTVKPWEQYEHCKIIRSRMEAKMQALMQSSTNELTDTRSAVEAWFLRLASVKPQHVGEVVYRMIKT